jgi:hypothetical protein
MSRLNSKPSVSRRAALAGVSADGLGVALGIRSSRSAQAMSTADHPLTGVWLAMANPPLPDDPQVAAPSIFGADGTVLLMFPLTQAGPQGVQFTSAYVGTWEPYDEQTGHFTATQMLSDAAGTFLGTVTVDGHPKVTDDGMSFIDDGALVTVTIRDATGVVVNVIPPTTGGRPVTAIKMRVGNPGFPGEEGATPVP